MKPSEKIIEIIAENLTGEDPQKQFNSAVLEYLDSEWQKKQHRIQCRHSDTGICSQCFINKK